MNRAFFGVRRQVQRDAAFHLSVAGVVGPGNRAHRARPQRKSIFPLKSLSKTGPDDYFRLRDANALELLNETESLY